MGSFLIGHESYVNATLVSNGFIDYYMKEANDAQIKVYLYLLRTMEANLPTSISEIADKFNHTEKDILRALKYWEKMNLLTLTYDSSKVLRGVTLKEIPDRTQPAEEDTEAVSSAVPKETEHISDKNVHSLAEKPAYTTADLRAFKDEDSTAQLLFVTETYIGRPLTPGELKTILYFSDCLHFSDDLIDYLIQYCVDRGKKDFKYIEAVAVNWAREGITTPKQAQKFAAKYDKSVYTIMKELGKSSSPTSKELEYINRWVKEYGFSQDIITEACERTVLATDSHRFEYAEGILSSWKKEDVHRKSDIQRIDDLYQKKKQKNTVSPLPAQGNRFNRFPQREYDFEELEAKLLSQ